MPRRLVDEHQPAGLVDRLEDRLRVERRERARVDHLGLDALRGQLLGRAERTVDRPAGGDDRHVAALAPDRGLAERDEVLAVRHLSVLEREQVVVEIDDRVVVADRGRHQALGVGGGRRHHDLQAGHAHEERADRAGVLARPAGGEAVARLEHERDLAPGRRSSPRKRGASLITWSIATSMNSAM